MSLEQWLRALRSRLSRSSVARRSRQASQIKLTPSLIAEVLETRELLSSVTGKVLDAADSDFSGTTNDVTANATVVDTLNLKSVTGDLKVSLSKMAGAAKIRVFVERTVGTTKTTATYIIKEGNGGLPNLLAGNNDSQRVQINMNSIGIDTLDLSTIANLQLASGKTESAVLAKLTRPGSAAIVANNASAQNIVIGKGGSATDTMDAILLTGSQIGTITKGTSFTGKLRLVFPNGPTDPTGPVRINAATLATQPLPGGTKLSGFTSANLNYLETGDGDQVLNIGNTPGLNAVSGKGDDTLIAGTGNQRLEGGTGNDTYVIEGNFANDTIVETSSGGTGDTISFNRPGAYAITASIYPNVPVSGPAGVNVVGTTSSWNKLDNAVYIEKLVGGNQTNLYRIFNEWSYAPSTTASTTYTFTIDDTTSTNARGTLDFSNVTHDLDIVINDGGEITATATVVKTVAGTTRTQIHVIKATGIANIIGGKGQNTYRINSANALKGRITTPAGGTNILHFKDFASNSPVIVDNKIKAVTGLAVATAPASQLERQRIAITGAASGSFTLSIGGVETQPIAWGATQPETRDNIQTAINTVFGAGFINVVNGGNFTWLLDFTAPANHPQFSIDVTGLRNSAGASLAANAGSITTTRNGSTPAGNAGIDRIDQVASGPATQDLVMLEVTNSFAGNRRAVVYAPTNTGTTATGGASGETLLGSDAADNLSGGPGHDTISGNGGDDIIRGDSGDDTLLGGSGNDNLSGGQDDDTIDGGAGNDSLLGGLGNDAYLFQNTWGSDTITEGDSAGEDNIDLTQITDNLSLVLSGGKLVAGSGALTLANKPGYFTGYRNVSGSFSGGDVLNIGKAGSFNEIQSISHGGAKAGSTFTLTFIVNGTNYTKTIAVGTNDAATASNLRTAFTDALGADSVVVLVSSFGTFSVEFLKPAATNIAPMTLNTSGLMWELPEPSKMLQAGGTGKNALWQFNIGMATGGTFTLEYNKGGVTTTSAIAVNPDPTVTATNIKTALTALGQDSMVSVSGMGIFKVEFLNTTSTAVTGFSVKTFNTLTYPAEVATLQEGQSGAEVQRIQLQNVASGTFVLFIGSQKTSDVEWNANPDTTAANIAAAINAVRQSTFSLWKFKVTVKGSGSANAQSFDVTFSTPEDADVADITVNTSGLTASSGSVTATVSTFQDGSSGGGLSNFETIKAPNADTTMVFGNEIINSLWDVAKQALIPGDFRDFGELNIDSSVLTESGKKLTLDFSNVTRPMNFTFESTGVKEVQRLQLNAAAHTAGSQFRLKLGSITTDVITVSSLRLVTANSIQNSLNKALKGSALDGLEVSVSASVKTAGQYDIVFSKFMEVEMLGAIGAASSSALAGATITEQRPGELGETTLTVEKVYNLPEIFEGSYVAELWSAYWAEITYDKIVITNVDANTTIIGGQNENTFAIDGSATFTGTIRGLTGLRPLTAFADYESITGAITLDIPNINTINTLDMSGSPSLRPTVVNLTHIVNGGAVDSQTVTQARDGREVQRLVIPSASTGKFTISGFKANGTTGFTTADISLDNSTGSGPTLQLARASATDIATRIENAINAALNEGASGGVKVSPITIRDGNGSNVTVYDITFQTAGVNYEALSLTSSLSDEPAALVSLSGDNVIAQGTASGAKITVDLTTVTATDVRLKLTLPRVPGAQNVLTTASTAKAAAGIEAAIRSVVKANGFDTTLGPASVTSSTSGVFVISFPRGNVLIDVLDAATTNSVSATVTVDKIAQQKNRVQKLTFNDATTGLVDISYAIAVPGQAPKEGTVSLDVASSSAATDLASALNTKLGAGSVSVSGTLASGLVVTFDEASTDKVTVGGMILPLDMKSRTLTKSADVTSIPVGPVATYVESVVHEIQHIGVNGTGSGSFKLTVVDPISSTSKTTANISFDADSATTAANIEAALNASGVLGTNATHVTVNPLGGFDIEYLLTGNISNATIAQQPTGATLAVEGIRSGSVSSNNIQKFRLNSADDGSFTLSIAGSTTAPIAIQGTTPTAIGKIDGFTIAARIKAELERLPNISSVNVTATQVDSVGETLLTASAEREASEIVFAVEFVTPDSARGFDGLSVDSTGLSKRLATAAPMAMLSIEDGQHAISEIQKLSRLDVVKAGTSFDLAFNGTKTTVSAFSTTAIQTAYDSLAGSSKAQVIGTDANNWLVTFTGNAGQKQQLSGMITTNASQIAQDVGFRNILKGLKSNTPDATGFTGVIQNMSNVVYGAGLNVILGSNVAIYESLLAGRLPTASSAKELVTNTSYALGKNEFSVGGNIYANKFDNEFAEDGTYVGKAKAAAAWSAKFITDTIASSILGGELSFGEPTIAPGIHLLSGLTGGDTYKFEGFWGVAAVIELQRAAAGQVLSPPPLAVAVFVTDGVAASVGVTGITKLVLPPAAKPAATVQVTVCPAAVQPAGKVPIVSPVGMVSVIVVTAVVAAVPVLLSCSV